MREQGHENPFKMQDQKFRGISIKTRDQTNQNAGPKFSQILRNVLWVLGIAFIWYDFIAFLNGNFSVLRDDQIFTAF